MTTEQDKNMPTLILISAYDSKALVSAFCRTVNHYDTQMLLLMIKQRTFGADWFIDCIRIACYAPSVSEWREDLADTFLTDRESSLFLRQHLTTIESFITYEAERMGIKKGEWLRNAYEWLPRNAEGEVIFEDSKELAEDLLASLTQKNYRGFDDISNYQDIVYDAATVRAILKTLCDKFIDFANRTQDFMGVDDGIDKLSTLYQVGFDDGYEQAKKDMLAGTLSLE